MNRLAYRLYRLVTGLRHWATRRLTPAGWIVLFGLIMTGGMATDTEQSLGYQAFVFLLCLAAGAVVLAPFFRLPYSAERIMPKFGSVGQPVRYTVRVRNRSKRPQAGLELLDGLADPRPTFAEFAALAGTSSRSKTLRLAHAPDFRKVRALRACALPAMAPGGESDAELELTPLKRGVLHFDHVIVARPDPFGLFRGFCRGSLTGTLTILPKRYALPRIALPGSQQYQQGGVALAAAIGESEEFVSLRDYRPGDAMRHIHWRSWAKIGRPVVKEFQDEYFVRHALILDTFLTAEDIGLFEEAVSVAASFACTIDTQESLLDLLFIGPEAYCFTIGRGVAHADQMLELLAAVTPSVGPRFAQLEQLVVEHAAAVSGCICLFVAWNEERRGLVRKLTAAGVPVLVLVILAAGAVEPAREPGDPAALHFLEAGQIERGLAKL